MPPEICAGVSCRGVLDAEVAELGHHPVADLLLRQLRLLAQGEGDVVEVGHRVEEGVLLKHHAEAAPGLVELDVGEGGDVHAVDHDLAAGGALQRDEVAHQGALARARSADDDQRLRAADGEVDAVEHGAVAVDLHQLLDDDVGRPPFPSAITSPPSSST
jgi:hypothetical protein